MKRIVDWKVFFISIGVASLIASIATWFGANFWIAFTMILLGMLINGWIAYFEAKRQGGFEYHVSDKERANE